MSKLLQLLSFKGGADQTLSANQKIRYVVKLTPAMKLFLVQFWENLVDVLLMQFNYLLAFVGQFQARAEYLQFNKSLDADLKRQLFTKLKNLHIKLQADIKLAQRANDFF